MLRKHKTAHGGLDGLAEKKGAWITPGPLSYIMIAKAEISPTPAGDA